MEARLDRAREHRRPAHGHEGEERVGARGNRLAGEDLAAIEGAREYRLHRAVMMLRGDDVASDERGDQREEPDRTEEQKDERDRETRFPHVAAKGDVVRLSLLEAE